MSIPEPYTCVGTCFCGQPYEKHSLYWNVVCAKPTFLHAGGLCVQALMLVRAEVFLWDLCVSHRVSRSETLSDCLPACNLHWAPPVRIDQQLKVVQQPSVVVVAEGKLCLLAHWISIKATDVSITQKYLFELWNATGLQSFITALAFFFLLWVLLSMCNNEFIDFTIFYQNTYFREKCPSFAAVKSVPSRTTVGIIVQNG